MPCGAGGSAPPDALMEAINASIGFDQLLYRQDIAGSKAHATMLAECGILSRDDAVSIQRGLDTILSEIESGRFAFSAALEDIHMNIEARLRDMIGDAAGRLHTARSRNDQVATDIRLYVRDQIDALDSDDSRRSAARSGQQGRGACGHDHARLHPSAKRPAGHLWPSYAGLCRNDLPGIGAGLQMPAARLNECPLGAAALAGTSFPIDRARRRRIARF
jgi:argininosuccinate lyase